MADHYGDAEIVFGKFRASCSNPAQLFGATKYCIFTPTTVTREVVEANVSERCRRMSATHVDLLQFHWQDYSDPQYLTALQYLQDDPRVHTLGLCNFDTHHMQKILDSGIAIATNQVQFSLVDSRPLIYMVEVCKKYNLKLLTYGTLLGGFLSEKWLGKPEPASLFADSITPSQRKYYEMILNWGSWALFQELLEVLSRIAAKHVVSVSNVATRWVLDFEFVGEVIVGTRWGVSDNAEDNLKVCGLRLDGDDRMQLETVLRRSRRDEMVTVLGDCGGEYR
jgi:aryl-alcohol dehydrogenase-like predicted oxidoreductase